jgi:hypothetical protein
MSVFYMCSIAIGLIIQRRKRARGLSDDGDDNDDNDNRAQAAASA